MDHFTYRNTSLWCEGVAAADLADRFGTPTYVYSTATLREHFQRIKAAFAELDPLICYSIKSCGNLAVCRVLADLGCGMDAVSGGEVERAWLAGCPMDKIVYAGVGKTDAEIRASLDGRYSLLSKGSPTATGSPTVSEGSGLIGSPTVREGLASSSAAESRLAPPAGGGHPRPPPPGGGARPGHARPHRLVQHRVRAGVREHCPHRPGTRRHHPRRAARQPRCRSKDPHLYHDRQEGNQVRRRSRTRAGLFRPLRPG